MSADNHVTLLAFAAAAPLLLGAGCGAIDRYHLPTGPTAANPQHAAAASIAGTDRQIDGRTPHRYTDLLHTYYASSVDKHSKPLARLASMAKFWP